MHCLRPQHAYVIYYTVVSLCPFFPFNSLLYRWLRLYFLPRTLLPDPGANHHRVVSRIHHALELALVCVWSRHTWLYCATPFAGLPWVSKLAPLSRRSACLWGGSVALRVGHGSVPGANKRRGATERYSLGAPQGTSHVAGHPPWSTTDDGGGERVAGRR